MFYVKLGHKSVWIELWSRLLAFREWDFHYERRTALFDTLACWVGPFHILICDLRPSWAAQTTDNHGGPRNG